MNVEFPVVSKDARRAGRPIGRVAAIAVALWAIASGCSDGPTSAGQDADTQGPTDTAIVDRDTAAPATACCPLGTCADSKTTCVAGACLPKLAGDLACYQDGQCANGTRCLGATFCACGDEACTPSAGECGFPEGCCRADSECEGGAVCLNGVCRGPASEGCWTDAACAAGETCLDVVAPPCGQRTLERPGFCGISGLCCASDAECQGGTSAARCLGGRCVEPASAAGACWDDAACGAGERCLGATLCVCENAQSATSGCAILPTPGRCGEVDPGGERCCVGAADCGGGEACVEGRCVVAPDAGRTTCWVDGHCGVGRRCVGASLRACGAEDGVDVLGHCETEVLPCTEDSACPSTMECVRADRSLVAGGIAAPRGGVCVERVERGCWSSETCHADERCMNEKICLDPEGCPWINEPGVCGARATRWQCCDAHNDCVAGFDCRNADSTVTDPPSSSAVCLNEAPFGERCWNNDDCPSGLQCERVWICGCNGKCFFNHQGFCAVPTNCQGDLDCGEGSVCAREPECLYSPCTTASTCQVGGRCQPVMDGGCWNHESCGEGRYCEGLRVCPSDVTCELPDQPGICAARAGLGACCTSFRGCEPGLRCLSPGQGNGCTLDVTSVCVPAVTTGRACYGDDDCDGGQRCDGERICPCGVATCSDPPQAGLCVPK